MPRRKISEYRAKRILSAALGLNYRGWSVAAQSIDHDISAIPVDGSFVVKVDQAVKKRFKNGLVKLDVPHSDLQHAVAELQLHGFDHFIIEPYVPHAEADERYLSLMRTKKGTILSVSKQGGVEIESNVDSLVSFVINDATNWGEVSKRSGFSREQIQGIASSFDQQYISLLEINPYLVQDGVIIMLDAAIEVDDAAMLLVDAWNSDDTRYAPRQLSEEEKTVAELANASSASFALGVIKPDGSIFLLLSGGGASVVVADEIYNAGKGTELANYGEYSGNPTEEETYIYATAVLKLMLRSAAPKKVLFIGGAVANFTNIAKTFAGIIRAINDLSDQLQQQQVKVVVRRGGPHQEQGLREIRATLEQYDLLGEVYDHRTQLGSAVRRALEEVNL